MGDGGGVFVMSARHDYVGDTRGSGIVPSTVDMLWMRGVGGVCVKCVCVWLGAVLEVRG